MADDSTVEHRLALIDERLRLGVYIPFAEIEWLLSRCRRLEAERNTARTDARNEAADAVDALYESAGPNNPLCTEDAYFLGVDHAFAAVRGLPVPETQEPQT